MPLLSWWPMCAGCWTTQALCGRWRSWAEWMPGGGGTVAAFMAERNIDTLDAGVPVLSMHSPFETVAKLDCYMNFKAAKAIFEAE